MAETVNTSWRETFANWPAGLSKRGVLTSTLNEPIPFKSFFVKGNMLLLERASPDPIGTRFILMEFGAIHLLKIIDPLTEAAILAAGYAGHISNA